MVKERQLIDARGSMRVGTPTVHQFVDTHLPTHVGGWLLDTHVKAHVRVLSKDLRVWRQACL